MPIEQQDAEEQFDRNLLVSIEKDVVPYLGDLRVGDEVTVSSVLVLRLAWMLNVRLPPPFSFS